MYWEVLPNAGGTVFSDYNIGVDQFGLPFLDPSVLVSVCVEDGQRQGFRHPIVSPVCTVFKGAISPHLYSDIDEQCYGSLRAANGSHIFLGEVEVPRKLATNSLYTPTPHFAKRSSSKSTYFSAHDFNLATMRPPFPPINSCVLFGVPHLSWKYGRASKASV